MAAIASLEDLQTVRRAAGVTAREARELGINWIYAPDCDLDIEPDNAVLLNDLAWALGELGDPKATEVAEKAYLQAPYNANVIDTLGWTLVRTGDTKRGVELIHAALNLAPTNSEIRLHLATAMIKAGDKAGARRELETLLSKLAKSSPLRADAEKLLGEI